MLALVSSTLGVGGQGMLASVSSTLGVDGRCAGLGV